MSGSELAAVDCVRLSNSLIDIDCNRSWYDESLVSCGRYRPCQFLEFGWSKSIFDPRLDHYENYMTGVYCTPQLHSPSRKQPQLMLR